MTEPNRPLDDARSGGSLGRRDVSQSVGVSLDTARRFWQALGFARVSDEERIFTDADRDALEGIVSLVRSGAVDEETALSLTRSFARAADQLASWQAQVLREMEDRRGEGGPAGADAATAAAHLLAQLVDDFEGLLVYAWRRHLAAAIEQLEAMGEAATPAPGVTMAPGAGRAVGFADMVGFTHLAQRLDERSLGALVERFEAACADIIAAHGGRLVKTIGDEVMFSARDVVAAVRIASDLHRWALHYPDADGLPQLRIGLAWGPVVARLGDLYGTTVNTAARLTTLARPGTLVVDEHAAAALAGVPGLTAVPLRRRSMPGLGPVQAYALRGTPPPRTA